MKTNITFKSHALSLSISSSLFATGALLAGSLLLAGCQSTGASQLSGKPTDMSNSASAAKANLAQALQKQRRSSYAYHSNLEINNDNQFSKVDSKQLVASDSLESYCEDSHDHAYADLLTKVEGENKEVSDIAYATKRHEIKQSYTQCATAYAAWESNQDDYDYDLENAADDEAYATDAEAYATDEAASEEYVIVEEASSDSADNETDDEAVSVDQMTKQMQPVAPYYQQLFDDFDKKVTPLDIKKAQLLDAYLLKPLSINAQGVYQPLAGKFTMLMSAQYSARNNRTSINQPIYIDFKTGHIYLWADNFALLTSEFADNKLGTKWQNKWLKLAIDDGSLPKGFGSAVIKAHFEALDRTYEAAPVAQFDYVSPSILTTLSPKLSPQHLQPMLNAQNIIRRQQDTESYEQFYKDYISIFYELITTQYPELIANKKPYEAGEPRPDANMLSSKALVQQALSGMKAITDRESDKTISDVYNNQDNPSTEESNTPNDIQTLYGLNKHGQIEWQHIRTQDLDNQDLKLQSANKGVTIDVLQQYMPLSSMKSAISFPNLPSHMQTPNASNTVDMREYGRELLEYYRQGNGTIIGKKVYEMLPFAKTLYLLKTEQLQYEDDATSTEEAIEVEEDNIIDNPSDEDADF